KISQIVVYPTFKDACFALGFLQDDKEYVEAIKEAKNWGTGHYFRKLFATMLITGSINKLEEVWKQTWHWLADDILYYQRRVLHDEALQLSDDELKNLTLLEIEKLLRSSGKSLKDYPPMPFTTTEFPSYIGNHEKLQIFNQVMQVVIEEKGGMFFLYGYGGTGKTYMWRTLASTLRAKKKIVLTVASSGIASLLLPSGRTAHSKFRIRVPTLDDSVCNITQGSDLAELLKVTSLIIWEEAPMAHKFCFKALDKTLNDIMKISDNSDTVLGGKTVVFGGDFRQILPMISRGTRSDIVFILVRPHPCTYNQSPSNSLESSTNLQKPFKKLFILNYTDPIDAIVQSTYPNIRQHYKDLEFLQSRAILASTNEIVDHINDYVLSLIPEEYLSSDSIEKFDTIESEGFSIITIEFLNSLSTSGLPNPKIKLKVGSPIMLLRNLDQNEGLCNGTRLIITRLANHIIEAKIMSGKGQGNTVYIPRLSMSPSQSPWPFKLIRRQFPIIVSYAMTINKSQGQSFASVGLYLPTTVFSHGQLYVALSRVQNKNGQKVMIHDKDKKPLSTTTNVVFKEEFQNL
ncbi:ATP-dependent DNA helicase PIF1, partial [Glycine soja]